MLSTCYASSPPLYDAGFQHLCFICFSQSHLFGSAHWAYDLWACVSAVTFPDPIFQLLPAVSFSDTGPSPLPHAWQSGCQPWLLLLPQCGPRVPQLWSPSNILFSSHSDADLVPACAVSCPGWLARPRVGLYLLSWFFSPVVFPQWGTIGQFTELTSKLLRTSWWARAIHTSPTHPTLPSQPLAPRAAPPGLRVWSSCPPPHSVFADLHLPLGLVHRSTASFLPCLWPDPSFPRPHTFTCTSSCGLTFLIFRGSYVATHRAPTPTAAPSPSCRQDPQSVSVPEGQGSCKTPVSITCSHPGACAMGSLYILMYLATPVLSCSMQALSCGMWDVVPWPRIELGPPCNATGKSLWHGF